MKERRFTFTYGDNRESGELLIHWAGWGNTLVGVIIAKPDSAGAPPRSLNGRQMLLRAAEAVSGMHRLAFRAVPWTREGATWTRPVVFTHDDHLHLAQLLGAGAEN